MATKLQRVSELADQTARSVTQDVNSWKSYLNTACRLFKYSFDEQLLIYAQRPDATACASMELWNGTMRRWVKPRSKGIALIHKNGSGRPYLEYVFDVSDTRAVRGAKSPYLWEMREEHHAAVSAALAKQYGETEESDIGQQIMEQARRAVNEIYRDHLQDLSYDVRDSLLEDLDGLNLEVRYQKILTASVQYTLLTRCGLDPSEYLEDEDLLGIIEFSTPAVLHHLGEATSAISMNMLNEIGSAIRSYDRDVSRNHQEKIEKPLANPPVIGYNTVKERFSALKRESKERSIEHGRTDIQVGGRLPDSQSDAGRRGRTGGDAPGQVRDAAGDIPGGTSPRDLHVDAVDRAAVPPSAGDRPAGAGAGGQDGVRTDGAERRERGNESPRSDGLGTGGEQLQGPGGGDRAGGDRLQVNPGSEQTAGAEPAVSASEEVPAFQFQLFPTVEEQVETIAQVQAEEQQQALSFAAAPVPDAVIARALTSGGNETHSIERIVAFFQKEQAGSAAATFMREEFGEGGKGVNIAGQDYALWFGGDGLRIAPGRSANTAGATLVPWAKAAALVVNSLRQGAFATQEKIDAAREYEFSDLAERLWYITREISDEAKDRGFFPSLADIPWRGAPDTIAAYAERLKDPETRKAVLEDLHLFETVYRVDRSILRFRPTTNLNVLYQRINDMGKSITPFRAVDGFAPATGKFITEDEIDALLKRGGNISGAKLRIYAYFKQGHDAKACVDFLKQEYGDGGGFGYTGYNEWHDSKGISLTRGDNISGFKGYDTVKLNWNQVQKRVRGLIEAGQYLNEQERARLPEYEKVQLARDIYEFQRYNSQLDHSSPDDWKPDGWKGIRKLLDDPARVETLFNQMLGSLAGLTEDTPRYEEFRNTLRNLAAYQRGEYSLYVPLPESVLQAERQTKQAAKGAKKKPSAPKRTVDEAPSDRLAAAARALTKKKQPQTKEEPSGQISFDFMTAQPPMEQSESQPVTPEKVPSPTVREIYQQYAEVIKNLVLEDHAYQNACANSDRDTACLEGNEAIKRAALTIAEPDFQKQYYDNAVFHKRLHQEIISETYPILSRPQPEHGQVQDGNAGEQAVNHAALYRIALDMVDREISRGWLYDYLRERDNDYDTARDTLSRGLPAYFDHVARGDPDMVAAYHTLPMFREWLIEDLLERNYQDVAIDPRDALERYAGSPDIPEWAKGAPPTPKPQYETWHAKGSIQRQEQESAPLSPPTDDLKPEQATAGTETPPAPETVPEPAGAGAPETEESSNQSPAEPNLTPNVDEYLNLKAQHPDKLVGVQVGRFMLFYGKDAEAAAPALGAKLLTREIPGLGSTSVTGSPLGWQSALKDLLEHGHSVVLARPDPERGPDAPYEIIKERDAADYIPLGMELTIDGRRMKIDSVDFNAGAVSLLDLDMKGWFPVFRSETVSFVREFVEEVQQSEEYIAAEMERADSALEQNSGTPPATDAPEERDQADDLETAKQLIRDFCADEYDIDEIDFSNLEHIGIAYTTTEDEKHEIQVEANLLDFSISQLVDDVCVERRSYSSLRELIDNELVGLNFDELVLLEHDLPPELELPEQVEIEGGQIVPPPPVARPRQERHNFQITDDNLGVGGEKTKYQYNVAAIRTLKQIETEGRLATPEEQETLSRYVGWGGLAQAFDPKNEKWAKEYAELKD